MLYCSGCHTHTEHTEEKPNVLRCSACKSIQVRVPVLTTEMHRTPLCQGGTDNHQPRQDREKE